MLVSDVIGRKVEDRPRCKGLPVVRGVEVWPLESDSSNIVSSSAAKPPVPCETLPLPMPMARVLRLQAEPLFPLDSPAVLLLSPYAALWFSATVFASGRAIEVRRVTVPA